MCPNCRAFITTDDKICPYCQVVVGPRAAERRSPADVMGGLIPHARFTTMMILLINAGFYIATVLYSMKTGGRGGLDLDGQTLFDFGAKDSRAIFVYGQWWRLITAGFLHGGLIHILMNSWVLFDLGVQVEQAYGTARYLVVYFAATITGFLLSAYWSSALSIGASAGLFGLIGAMIAFGIHHRSSFGTAVRNMYLRWAIYMLIIGLLPIFSVDNAAHIGGGLGGFAVGYLAGTPGYSRTTEAAWRGAAACAGLITLFAFVKMYFFLIAQQQ